ncbi:ATP-dependent helicase, partial [alpha proteobacterium AAP81b]
VLGAMLVAGAARGLGRLAAEVAVVLTERGLGGRSPDLDERLRQWRRDHGPRAGAARQLAARWARLAGAGAEEALPADAAAQVLALAFPDRVAKRRGGGWLMANGRAVSVDAGEALATSPWVVVGDAAGAAGATRLLLGAALEEASLAGLGLAIAATPVFAFDPASGAVVAESVRRLGAITLARAPDPRPDPLAVTMALLAGVREHSLALLHWGEASAGLRARVAFVRGAGFGDFADLSDAALLTGLDDWLAPLLVGKRRLDAVGDAALAEALGTLVGWADMRRLDTLAPRQFETPAGSHHAIDYAAEGGPAVDVRVQALFGLAAHPMLAEGRVPLTLRLTSPAGRPIQVTKDLPRFWAGSWADVRKDLRGRYPKHPWPEDPAAAPPTLRAKPRGQAG